MALSSQLAISKTHFLLVIIIITEMGSCKDTFPKDHKKMGVGA